MSKRKKDLSQEEIWDDSGLLESWNQSYEEYKVDFVYSLCSAPTKQPQRYHSIHARGERVRDVLKAAEQSEEQKSDRSLLNVASRSTNDAQPEKTSGQDSEGKNDAPNLRWRNISKACHNP